MPAHKTKTDRRLLGTWRSDKRRTLKEWVWRPGTTAKQRKFITDIFGHLTIRFGNGRRRIEFKGERDSQRYEVIGADSDSVAIMYYDDLMKERRIDHIHFEGDRHYWISIGRQREWFRRVTDRAT